MKRSERLERINAINHGLESMAGAKLAAVYAEYSAQMNQLEQLKIYKDDYADQLKIKMNNNMNPNELRDYKYFFSSIENAIHQQESMVNHLYKKLEGCQQEWFEKRNEVERINIAGENLRRAEELQETRRAQKINDELSAMMYSRQQSITNH